MQHKKPLELTDVEFRVVRDSAAALLCTIFIGIWSYWLLTHYYSIPTTTADALRFAFDWLVFPFVMLAVAILMVSWGRRQSVTDSLGSAHSTPSRALAVKVAYLQNTLEQTVLLTGVVLITAASLSPLLLALIPGAIVAFVVGRVFFYIGYSHHPLQRAFGMALTMLPALGLLFLLLVIKLSESLQVWFF